MTSEVERLVNVAAEIMRSNGREPTVTEAWHEAIRQLLNRAPATRIEAAIRFAFADTFWRERCFSLPYLLTKWASIEPRTPASAAGAAGEGDREARWPAIEQKLRASLPRARECVTGRPVLNASEIDEEVDYHRRKFLRLREAA